MRFIKFFSVVVVMILFVGCGSSGSKRVCGPTDIETIAGWCEENVNFAKVEFEHDAEKVLLVFGNTGNGLFDPYEVRKEDSFSKNRKENLEIFSSLSVSDREKLEETFSKIFFGSCFEDFQSHSDNTIIQVLNDGTLSVFKGKGVLENIKVNSKYIGEYVCVYEEDMLAEYHDWYYSADINKSGFFSK